MEVGGSSRVAPDGLVPFALESLHDMQLPSGLFCEEAVAGSDALRGVSLRYTAMAYLGLCKADSAGYDHGFELERIESALLERAAAPELRPGDLGLYLWADARAGWGQRAELLERLEQTLVSAGGLRTLEGMELGWIVEGLLPADGEGPERELLDEALGVLLEENAAPSGLLYHSASRGPRRRFPNFATQIYGVLALAAAARRGGGQGALATARRIADVLLRLQLPDGGWPWLYDAETGGCRDGLHIDRVNQNQGAESTLAFLLSLAEMHRAQNMVAALEQQATIAS